MNGVEHWFAAGFSQLDPLLQDLHRHGGSLEGPVTIHLASGLAGWLGKRLAARIGVPLQQTTPRLQVSIYSEHGVLHWNRSFGGAPMNSQFVPVGTWPNGYWLESTGALRLALQVNVREGGWYWQPIRAWVRGVRVPLMLLPRTTAYKRIEQGRYQFYVGFSLPLLGTLLSYSGTLTPTTGTAERP